MAIVKSFRDVAIHRRADAIQASQAQTNTVSPVEFEKRISRVENIIDKITGRSADHDVQLLLQARGKDIGQYHELQDAILFKWGGFEQFMNALTPKKITIQAEPRSQGNVRSQKPKRTPKPTRLALNDLGERATDLSEPPPIREFPVSARPTSQGEPLLLPTPPRETVISTLSQPAPSSIPSGQAVVSNPTRPMPIRVDVPKGEEFDISGANSVDVEPGARDPVVSKRIERGFDLDIPLGSVGRLPTVDGDEVPAFLETLGAGFRLGNAPVSAFVSEPTAPVFTGPFGEIRPGFEDFDPFENIEGYEDNAISFVFATNPNDVATIKHNIDRENEDRATLQAAGWGGMAALFAAGLLDPILLFPAGGVAVKSATLGKTALESGLLTARAGFLGSTASEVVLLASQETLTPEEAALNITASTFLSGVLGAAVPLVAQALRRSPRALANDVARDLEPGDGPDIREAGSFKAPDEEFPGAPAKAEPIKTEGRTADAAEEDVVNLSAERARRLTEDDLPENPVPPLEETGSVGAATANETLAENTLKSALGVEKALAFEDPLLRSATSPFLAARLAIQELARSPFSYRKNQLGVASPQSVEVMIDAWQFPLAQMFADTDRLFVKYRTGRVEGGQMRRLAIEAMDIAAPSADKLNFRQFKQEIARAMRRGDTHPIPEINELAGRYRSELFGPLKERAIKAGLLPEDIEVDTALSYMMRVYNTEKIVAQRPEFVRIVQNWLIRRRDADARRITALESELAAARARPGASKEVATLSDELDEISGRADLDDLELEDVAQQITDRILGTPDGRLPYDVTVDTPRRGKGRQRPGARGPLKARVFTIEDELIEPFLESDIELISRIYTRTMASDSELALRFGSIDLVTQIDDIRREAARAVSRATTEAERRRLDRLKNQAIRDIAAVRDRLRGTYGAPTNPRGVGVRAARVAGQISLLSKLGGVLVSSLPDIARPIMAEGLGRVVRHALIPLVANSRQFKVARQEAKFLGNVTERILDSRIGAIADIAEGYGRFSKFERWTQKLTDTFGMVTMLSPWNQYLKEFTGVVTMSRIVDVSQQWSRGKIKQRDLERMTASGIDQPMAKRIAKEFENHGVEDRGVFIPGTSTWTDAEARLVLRNAVTLEVDNTIVTPGVAQRPLWMSMTAGRLVGQFKSFSFASTQSVLIAGLQRRDAATLNGMLLSVMAGMFVYVMKQQGAGRELSDDPAVWMSEGVDRSGLTGILYDVNDQIERATRGVVGISAITGGPASSRFAARNTAGAVLGPSFGMSQDLIQVLGATVTADFQQSDTRALRRLLPYQNLFYIRQLLDVAEARVNDELGIDR